MCEGEGRDLRDGEASNGEARDNVTTEKRKVILRSPMENGEEELKSENELIEGGLVFETVEWIIWEEDFRESVFKFVKCSCFWW